MPSTPVSKHIPQVSLKRKHRDGPESLEQSPTKRLLSFFAWFSGTQEIDQYADVKKKNDSRIDKILELVDFTREDQQALGLELDGHEDRLVVAEDEIEQLREKVESLEDTIRRLEESSARFAQRALRLTKIMDSFVNDVSRTTDTFIKNCRSLEGDTDSDKPQSIISFKADGMRDNDKQDDTSDDGEIVDGGASEVEPEF